MKLAASLRYALYGTLAALLASGVAWLWWPGASMRFHGAAAMVILILAGAAIAQHVGAGWRERKNIASGVVLASALLALTITGYLLYYAGEDRTQAIANVVHWIFGVAAPLVMVWHARVK